MNASSRSSTPAILAFAAMALAVVWVGQAQSWSLALSILNYCVIAAIMSLGLNVQWGYAGLFNVGLMGFAALGGMAAVLVAMPPTEQAWQAGGAALLTAMLMALITTIAAILVYKKLKPGGRRRLLMTVVIVTGLIVSRWFFDPAIKAIESVDPSRTGYLGGAGLPILISWLVGGLLAAAAAWLIGKITLGLRADYLAIATLGISEIVLSMLRYEEWLTRGVKNVNGLPRPVPYEVDIQQSEWGITWAEKIWRQCAGLCIDCGQVVLPWDFLIGSPHPLLAMPGSAAISLGSHDACHP